MKVTKRTSTLCLPHSQIGRYTPLGGGDQHLHHQPPVKEKRRLGIGSIMDHIPAKVSICLEEVYLYCTAYRRCGREKFRTTDIINTSQQWIDLTLSLSCFGEFKHRTMAVKFSAHWKNLVTGTLVTGRLKVPCQGRAPTFDMSPHGPDGIRVTGQL